ncbi:hypothetical protein T492DRAFT_931681 [Pavlovales sp. CCMP2436]|nr:hypothetical protein T492DRAFT_931681 [Pavlovales sp. CCMP2436]
MADVPITLRDLHEMGARVGAQSGGRSRRVDESKLALQGSHVPCQQAVVAVSSDRLRRAANEAKKSDRLSQDRVKSIARAKLAKVEAARRLERGRPERDEHARKRERERREQAAKLADERTHARIRDQARVKDAQAEATRRLELGRRKPDDRRRRAQRDVREIGAENNRLEHVLTRAKPIFATREQINALQGLV